MSRVAVTERTIAVIVHSAGGNRGWQITARLPTSNGPSPSRLMLLTEGVHSCQRAVSFITSHTRSAGAAMSIVMLKLLILPLPRPPLSDMIVCSTGSIQRRQSRPARRGHEATRGPAAARVAAARHTMEKRPTHRRAV
jgi:hypothetical protein